MMMMMMMMMMMDIYIARAIHAIVACSVRTGLPYRREQEIQYRTNKQTNEQQTIKSINQ